MVDSLSMFSLDQGVQPGDHRDKNWNNHGPCANKPLHTQNTIAVNLVVLGTVLGEMLEMPAVGSLFILSAGPWGSTCLEVIEGNHFSKTSGTPSQSLADHLWSIVWETLPWNINVCMCRVVYFVYL